MEQATRFPRIPSPPPGSRDSDSPPSSSGATSPISDYSSQPLLSTNSDYSLSKASTTTNPPPGFMASSSSASGSSSARNLVHPGSNIFGLDGLTLTQRNVSNFNGSSNMNSCGEDDNISGASSTPSSSSTSGSLVGASSNTDIATTINTSTNPGFQVVSSLPSNSGLTTTSSSSHQPSAFQALTEFSALSQAGITGYPLLLNSYAGGVSNLQNSENYEKYLKAKQRKTNRARKNDKNVVVQCKAEDVEGYEGEKTINDLLESLGEATTSEDKKQKQKRSSKDKRDKKRRSDKSATTGAAVDEHKEEDDAADQEDNVDDEEEEIQRMREIKEKKKKKGGSKAAATDNSAVEYANQNNVFMVSADDNLKASENLATSSDSLNFVPVTGKKKMKKLKDEQEKMKDYQKKDTDRPTPGSSRESGPSHARDARSSQNRDARMSQTRDAKQVPDNRRTSNYSLRSREVQISPEPEKNIGNSASLNQEPAFDAIQDFPALSTGSQTEKPLNKIHSAWVRKPSSGSCSSTTPLTTTNNNTSTVAVTTTTTSAHPIPEQKLKHQPCDKLSVTQPTTNATIPADVTNTDDVFTVTAVVGKDSSSIDAAKNTERSHNVDPSPYSVNTNISEITCDKSIVNDELSPLSKNAGTTGDKDIKNTTSDKNKNTAPPSAVEITQPVPAQSANTSSNPLINDDILEAAGLQSTARSNISGANGDVDGGKLGEFHFDTRADGAIGGELAVTFTQEMEEGEISFGFDINYQLIDASLTTEQIIIPTPDDVHEGGGDNHEGGVVNVADGLDHGNIASVDKAIVSFSTAQGVLVGGGYNFMNNIHPQFASNDMPPRSQVNVSGTPCSDGRQEVEPKEVEVVSPESGICSPLSWQGEGEVSWQGEGVEEAGNTSTSPPIQPGSYPRRPAQENRDLISELKKLKYRGSSRSPSPPNSVRSVSAGSITHGPSDLSFTHGPVDLSFTHGPGDISFPRSEDSGLNTTRNQMEQCITISTPSPNHSEIVSFLQNNWEQFSKDKKVKVYGEKKERR